jgi:5-methyltetrahydropteroyltriglutamate--homocysteine methyltransferase
MAKARPCRAGGRPRLGAVIAMERPELPRTDHVGSMQRPTYLFEARQGFMQGKVTAEQLRATENQAILEALELQRQSGIGVETDGEFRRLFYGSHVLEAIDGYKPFSFGIVERRLTKKHRFNQPEDIAFISEKADRLWKLTIPTPARIRDEMMKKLNPAYEPQPLPSDYSSFDEVQSDIVDFYIDEIEQLAGEGVQYLQFDKVITAFVDEEIRDGMRAGGEDPVQALAAEIDWENKAYDVAREKGMITAMHMCRGNRGRTEADFGAGAYDPAAEQLFNDLHVDRLLLEYDTERAGGFEPLRLVPKDRTVVLGLVSTKTTEVEDPDVLLARIDEAARYIDPGQLALGPQCGFSSGARPEQQDLMTIDAERRKLEVIAETAQRAWG